MVYITTTLVHALASVPFVLATPLATNAPQATSPGCHSYVLVSTRGTGEPQGPSAGFVGMINQTLAAIPGGIEYDTVYPASTNGSEVQGADDIRRYINAGLQACPNQRYALLGYSQGATSASIAMNYFNNTNSAAFKAIKASVLIGNPVKKGGEVSNVDENGGSSTRSTNGVFYDLVRNETLTAPWYASGKVEDICYSHDLICNGFRLGNNFPAHLAYPFSKSVQNEGAQFLIAHLK